MTIGVCRLRPTITPIANPANLLLIAPAKSLTAHDHTMSWSAMPGEMRSLVLQNVGRGKVQCLMEDEI